MLGLGFTEQILTLTKIFFCAGEAGGKAFLVWHLQSFFNLNMWRRLRKRTAIPLNLKTGIESHEAPS